MIFANSAIQDLEKQISLIDDCHSRGKKIIDKGTITQSLCLAYYNFAVESEYSKNIYIALEFYEKSLKIA